MWKIPGSCSTRPELPPPAVWTIINATNTYQQESRRKPTHTSSDGIDSCSRDNPLIPELLLESVNDCREIYLQQTDLHLEIGDQISAEMEIDDGWQGVCVCVCQC